MCELLRSARCSWTGIAVQSQAPTGLVALGIRVAGQIQGSVLDSHVRGHSENDWSFGECRFNTRTLRTEVLLQSIWPDLLHSGWNLGCTQTMPPSLWNNGNCTGAEKRGKRSHVIFTTHFSILDQVPGQIKCRVSRGARLVKSVRLANLRGRIKVF